MKTALYARVSTSEQNCEAQIRELRAYAQARTWEVAREYVDSGWSGAKAERPELKRLMQDARNGEGGQAVVAGNIGRGLNGDGDGEKSRE